MHRSLQTPRKIAGCVRGRKPPRRTRQLARTRTPRTKFGQESFRAAGNAVSHCTSVQGGSLHTPPCKLLSGLPISSDRCPSVRTGWYRRSVASSRPVTGESTKTRRGRSPRPAPRPPPPAKTRSWCRTRLVRSRPESSPAAPPPSANAGTRCRQRATGARVLPPGSPGPRRVTSAPSGRQTRAAPPLRARGQACARASQGAGR